jgi:RimJ/RimL family protein N-acetyltransferase
MISETKSSRIPTLFRRPALINRSMAGVLIFYPIRPMASNPADKVVRRPQAGTETHLVIRLNSTNEFVGAAGLHPADATMLETGIWIKELAQGHGYGARSCAAVITWAREGKGC